MPSALAGPEGARVLRWMEDSPVVFETLRRMLHEYDQCKEVARTAQTERDRLQQQCVALREEVRRLQVESKRLQKERADAAEWVTTMLQEAAARFPITPPRA
jgi:branched-subunit amino acid aminotransferase/4-amino-4-deoxychorismate lyase